VHQLGFIFRPWGKDLRKAGFWISGVYFRD